MIQLEPSLPGLQDQLQREWAQTGKRPGQQDQAPRSAPVQVLLNAVSKAKITHTSEFHPEKCKRILPFTESGSMTQTQQEGGCTGSLPPPPRGTQGEDKERPQPKE